MTEGTTLNSRTAFLPATMRIAHCFYHAWIVVAWLGIGCGGGASSSQPIAPQPASRARVAAAPLWPKLDQVSNWPKLDREVKAGGHSGQPYRVELRVDPVAWTHYQGLVAGSELPPGSTLVQFHRDLTDRRGPSYVMEKTVLGKWTYYELDATGHIQRSGDLSQCARCHAEGVADFLFGPERTQHEKP
jgi:hypothetical protein